MKICICDDNQKDKDLLKSAITLYYNSVNKIRFDIICCSTPEELFKELDSNKFDILFLDIYLKQDNGFLIAKQIKDSNNIPIILYSSSKDFAIEGYQINIFGYLLKPLDSNKLFILLNKYHKLSHKKIIELKAHGKTEYINTSDIIYAESKGRKITIFLTNKIQKSYYLSLDQLEEKIDSNVFLRTHKSYLVNMKKVKKLTNRWFEVEENYHILIKIKGYKEIAKKYNDFMIQETNVDLI